MSDGDRPAGVDSEQAALAATPNTPQRTCIGCRLSTDKANLVRLVMIDGSCVVDHQAQLPGRGAYLHPRSACFELALRRRALVRALRANGSLNTDAVREYVSHVDQYDRGFGSNGMNVR